MTRAFLFLGHGDIRSALILNVNSLPVFLAVIVLWVQSALALCTGREIRVQLARHERYFTFLLALSASVSGWLYNMSWNPWV